MRLLFISKRVANFRTRLNETFTLPERFKGTIVEKWTKYWRALMSDYAEVATNLVKEARNKPPKVMIIGGISYLTYLGVQNNPDEDAFLRELRRHSNNLVMVPTTLQNPVSAEYLRDLEQAINQNKLRFFSLGLCTLLWIDLYDKDDCTYPAICEYTKVGYWNFHKRVTDIGFCNRFWHLEWKMRNYDVNYL